MKNKLGSYYKGNFKEDVKVVVVEGIFIVYFIGFFDFRDLVGIVVCEQVYGGLIGINVVGGVQVVVNVVKCQFDVNFDQEVKDKVKVKKDEYCVCIKDYFFKKMFQECCEQIIWCFKVSFVEYYFCFFCFNIVCRKWFWSVSSILIIMLLLLFC